MRSLGAKLLVRDLVNLRVAGTSVMSSIAIGNTNAFTMALESKSVEFIVSQRHSKW